jgi:type IX secretion system PorP/SprF family membrane protein
MRRFIIITLLLLICIELNAQQLPFQTNFVSTEYNVNPAFTGIYDYIPIRLNSRLQWVGIENAPQTHSISAHSSITKANGIGVHIYSDKLSNISYNMAELSFSHKIQLDDNLFLSGGVGSKYVQTNFSGTDAIIIDESDPVFQYDETVGNIDFSMGYLLYSDNVTFGISTPNLLGRQLDFVHSIDDNIIYRHIYLMGSVYKEFNKLGNFAYEPSILIKMTKNADTQIDAAIKFYYRTYLCLGLQYRTQDAVSLVFGLDYNQYFFNYSYDITTSKLSQYSNGTHEITLGYNINVSAWSNLLRDRDRHYRRHWRAEDGLKWD